MSNRSESSPGYSTANDFSGQEPVRGRLQPNDRRREYRGYGPEDYPQYNEMRKRSEYPETYRSAMSGYRSEHVGSDSGRRDYNYRAGEGNLYGTKYSKRRYHGEDARGYMSEDDYDRGTPMYQRGTGYDEMNEAFRGPGAHRGKGPRNYRRADIRITEEINDRLTDDSMVDATEIEVVVENGEATLNGTVEDHHAKRRAEDIAESVSGVTHVVNRLRYHQSMRNNPGFIVTPY